MLERRNISGQASWAADDIFRSGQPALWAPAADWRALEEAGLLVTDSRAASVSIGAKQQQQAGSAGVSWVFVPSYNRSRKTRQTDTP